MTRTATPAPTDRSMWRMLLLRIHPDQGGDGDLFVWARNLQERVEGCSGCAGHRQDPRGAGEGGSTEYAERVDFPNFANHERITQRAVEMASEVCEPYARLLRDLASCGSSPASPRQERTGATYSYSRTSC